MDNFQFHLQTILQIWPFLLLTLIIAFTVHEFSHAYVAYKFGDNTPLKDGRLTLNPMAHLDVFGTIMIFLAGFGWAKPVMVNRGNFRQPRFMGIVVSAVGPLSNLLLAIIGIFLMAAIYKFAPLGSMSAGIYNAIHVFFSVFIQLNIVLFIFNLIPLPPLDGYRIVEDLASLPLRERMRKLEHWAIIIFLLMVFIPPIQAVTLGPIFSLVSIIEDGLLTSILPIFGL